MTARATTAEHTAGQERQARRTAELSTMSATERAIVSDQEANEARLEALESEATDLENQIATLADEPGNGREIAKLTRQIAQTTTKIDAEAGKKAYLAQQREKITGANKTAREAAPADGVKVLANGAPITSFSPKTQAWLEAHPQSFTDVRFVKKAILAAQEAVDVEGIADDSAEFFGFVEDRLGLKVAPETDVEEEEGEVIEPAQVRESYTPENPQRSAAGPGALSSVAPPTRQTPQGGNGGGNRRAPTLTAQEREVALSLYPDSKLSDADKLVRYAAGKKFMNERNNQHFRGNN